MFVQVQLLQTATSTLLLLMTMDKTLLHTLSCEPIATKHVSPSFDDIDSLSRLVCIWHTLIEAGHLTSIAMFAFFWFCAFVLGWKSCHCFNTTRWISTWCSITFNFWFPWARWGFFSYRHDHPIPLPTAIEYLYATWLTCLWCSRSIIVMRVVI